MKILHLPLAALLSTAVGCGAADMPPNAGSTETTGTGACAVGCSAPDAGYERWSPPQREAGPAGDAAAAEGSSPDLGAIAVVDVASTPCVETSARAVTVMESEPQLITFDRAGVVGARRFAVDGNTLSMLTFGSDGTAASPIVPNVLVAKGTADQRLAALASDGKTLSLRFYDSEGRAVGSGVDLGTGSTGTPILAVGPSSILALWQSDGVLKGRLATNEGKLGPVVDLGTDSCGDSNCTVRAIHNGRDFTVIWSRVLQDERTKTSWATVGADGKVGLAKPVLLSTGFHRLVDVALVGSSYALLLGEGFPTRHSVVVFLDAYGNVLGPARRLLGSTQPWGLAGSAGGIVGVTASLSDGRAALRTLTTLGEAVDGWICLDDSAPDTEFSSRAAILGDDAGYEFVVRMTDGSASHLRTDPHGKER